MTESSTQELLAAYELIIEPPQKPGPESIQRLKLPTLKTAYRKKALETHPDRSIAIGKIESDLNPQFARVSLAYQKLHAAIHRDHKPMVTSPDISTANPTTYSRSQPSKPTPDLRYRGGIPKRALLTGQFLYYSGLISWPSLIEAICWQRRQRPRIGEIAKQWGILSTFEINNILIERAWERGYTYKFADYAMRKGYITPFEQMALLGKQLRLQRPIGEYFIAKKLLSPQDMKRTLHELALHNRNMTWICQNGHRKRNKGKMHP